MFCLTDDSNGFWLAIFILNYNYKSEFVYFCFSTSVNPRNAGAPQSKKMLLRERLKVIIHNLESSRAIKFRWQSAAWQHIILCQRSIALCNSRERIRFNRRLHRNLLLVMDLFTDCVVASLLFKSTQRLYKRNCVRNVFFWVEFTIASAFRFTPYQRGGIATWCVVGWESWICFVWLILEDREVNVDKEKTAIEWVNFGLGGCHS